MESDCGSYLASGRVGVARGSWKRNRHVLVMLVGCIRSGVYMDTGVKGRAVRHARGGC